MTVQRPKHLTSRIFQRQGVPVTVHQQQPGGREGGKWIAPPPIDVETNAIVEPDEQGVEYILLSDGSYSTDRLLFYFPPKVKVSTVGTDGAKLEDTITYNNTSYRVLAVENWTSYKAVKTVKGKLQADIYGKIQYSS